MFFYVDLRSKLVLCMNMWWTTRTCEEHIKTIKNIQTYSREFKWLFSCFNLKLSSWQHKKQLGKEIIPSCKIHTVEEEALDGSPNGGEKEELGLIRWNRPFRLWWATFISHHPINLHVKFNVCACNKP